MKSSFYYLSYLLMFKKYYEEIEEKQLYKLEQLPLYFITKLIKR